MKAETKEKAKQVVLLGIGLVALISLVVLMFGVAWVGVYLGKQSITAEAKLPLLTIIGVIGLFSALAVVAFGLAGLNLADKTQALALPEGSVRAAIALSLVVLFAIISVSLFSALSESPIRHVEGLTKKESDDFTRDSTRVQFLLVQPVPAARESTYTVYYRQTPSPASEGFAKQLLVIIGTLVTAVSSFYFGTKAAASAPEGPARPTLTSVDPSNITAGGPDTELTLKGRNLLPVTSVSLVRGQSTLVTTDVTSGDATITGKVRVPAGTPAGEWDVLASDEDGRTARLPAAVTIQ